MLRFTTKFAINKLDSFDESVPGHVKLNHESGNLRILVRTIQVEDFKGLETAVPTMHRMKKPC